MWPHITNAVLSGWRLRTLTGFENTNEPIHSGKVGQPIHAFLKKGQVIISADGGVDLMEALQHLEDELRMRAARPQG